LCGGMHAGLKLDFNSPRYEVWEKKKQISSKPVLSINVKLSVHISALFYVDISLHNAVVFIVTVLQLFFTAHFLRKFLNFFNYFDRQEKFLKFTTMLAICSRIYSNICVTVIRN